MRGYVGVEKQLPIAFDCGYRLIDTAQRYENEEGVGTAIVRAQKMNYVKRDELFVVTKLWADNMASRPAAAESIDISLNQLKLDAIDLFLIHWPGDFSTREVDQRKKSRFDTWQALEEAVQAGKVRNIGVSNYAEKHLRELLEYAKIKPAVNQFEIHPYNVRDDLVNYCYQQGVQVMAYSPLGGRGAAGPGTGFTDELLKDPVVTAVAAAHQASVPQVLLRWLLQRGITPIPKAVSREHLEDNRKALNIELTDAEMKALSALDKKQFVVFDSNQMD